MVGIATSPDRMDHDTDEAWIRRADGEQAIRSRLLNKLLARGESLTEVRLLEGEDGVWSVQFRLAGLKGPFVLNQHESDDPKRYKDVTLAIRMVWADLGYRGNILLTTERDHTPRIRSARGGGQA